MKYYRIIIAVYFGVMVFTLANILYSDTGIYAMQNLVEYRERLILNLDNLQKLNQELGNRSQALHSDRELIVTESRDLGYFNDQEVVIRLQGYAAERETYSAGIILGYSGYLQDPGEDLLRLLGLGVGIFAYLILWALKKRQIQ